MNFCSDNVTGCNPEILAAMVAVNEGTAMPYGNDDITQQLQRQFCQLFETEVAAFPVATGSAANALALGSICPPYSAIFCHENAHINCDECGAPEFYTGGAKLITLPGEAGKLDANSLATAIRRAEPGTVHHVQPAAVSLTQGTEAGTLYRLEEIAAIAAVAHDHQLLVHLDGARFANALVTLGCTPAEMTWKAGVDVVSFGATKNGAIAAEAVIFFKDSLGKDFPFRRKRGGHLFSKQRFLSVQLQAYLKDELWLKNARHANEMATKLAAGLRGVPGVRLLYPVEINEVFVDFPQKILQGLLDGGFQFYYQWDEDASRATARLVTAFNTEEADISALVDTARRVAQPLEA